MLILPLAVAIVVGGTALPRGSISRAVSRGIITLASVVVVYTMFEPYAILTTHRFLRDIFEQ